MTVLTVFAVAMGGALGAVSRYVVSGWIQDASASFFPWGTLGVNVLGSLLLGFALVWLQGTVTSAETRALLTIGFLGSFTTFSTFSYETVAMLRDGEWWRAGAYAMGSLALGLFAIATGAALASGLLRARSG
jgi:CrcB protein